jgi:hypothetical protein
MLLLKIEIFLGKTASVYGWGATAWGGNTVRINNHQITGVNNQLFFTHGPQRTPSFY